LNKNWRNRPTHIDSIPRNIDYIIGIDESGNADLKHVRNAKTSGKSLDKNERHFTVTACCIATSKFVDTREAVMALKHKYWQNALFQYKDGLKRICFHSRDIRKKSTAFKPGNIDYDGFIHDLGNLLSQVPICLYSSHIDKLAHVEQYTRPQSPYDLCMTFVLERIVYSIGRNASYIIVLESRGKKEDKELLDFIKRLLDHGSNYCSSKEFSCIKGVYFNPKWCNAADSQMSYWLLELADLYAYPIQKYFVHNKKDMAFQTLYPKISGYPEVTGKGLKSFP